MVRHLKKILLIYSEIFFADNTLLGVMVAASTFIDPNIGVCGLMAVAAAYLFSRLTFAHGLGFEPFYYYNPLLVGLFIGMRFNISVLTVALVLLAGIFTFILTVVLNFLLRKYTGLPVLSVPFVVASSFIYLGTLRSSGLYSNFLQYHAPVVWEQVPDWINGYFLSLGSIFFSTNILVGLLIALGILLHSRIMFLLTIMGYYAGALLTGEFNSTASTTFLNLNYFNFILIAVAIGSVYLIPSIKSYLVALCAVGISYLILGAAEVLFQSYGLPVFTLPFNIVVLSFVYYSDIINSRLRTYTYLKNPEANLDFYLNYIKRFGLACPAISLPFAGAWTIAQGFDGEYTHKGIWRYGIDFVISDDDGQQFTGPEDNLASYYGFNKPVLSPVAGTVVHLENTVEDGEPGTVNRGDNWGNHVVLYDARGFYVKICHLKKGTIIPQAGMTVEPGEVIGRCGNSGYSPCPHIHIQVQPSHLDSAPTMEFVFEQVVTGDRRYHHHLEPRKGQVLSALQGSLKKKNRFELLLGDTFTFTVDLGGRETRETVSVELELDGTSCLRSGSGKLYFEIYKNIFRFYKYTGSRRSVLRYLYLALPSLPLCRETVDWTDDLPLDASLPVPVKETLLLLQSFIPSLVKNPVTLRYRDTASLETANETIVLGRSVRSIRSVARLGARRFVDSISIEENGRNIEISCYDVVSS